MEINIPQNQEGIPSLGDIHDQLIREVSISGMNDYYLGSAVDPGRDILKLFFSDEADPATLEEIASAQDFTYYTIEAEETDEYGSGFAIVAKAVSELDPEKDDVSAVVVGNVDHEVEISGDVDVRVQ